MNIKKIVKNSKLILWLYQTIGSFLLRFLSHIISCDEKLILFVSYGGRYYNDSPMFIYERMLNDSRYADYKLVWAFVNPENHAHIPHKVKIDSLAFYQIALKARCWITNVIVERGLNFKPNHCFYFHTTHVTLPKYTGYDAKELLTVAKNFTYKFDMSCAQSEYEKELQKRMYGLKEEQVLVCGYPKNDHLCNFSIEECNIIKAKIGVPKHKKIILYAPTFRGNIDSQNECSIDFDKWFNILGEEYIILFRAHPIVASQINYNKYKSFVLNVSNYSDNVDLMMAADVLISDYSGIFFEFGVQNKPMYCFAYDYDEYIKDWNLYVDVREEIPGGDLDEEGLLHLIKRGETREVANKLSAFRNKYITAKGQATTQAVDTIYENIRK